MRLPSQGFGSKFNFCRFCIPPESAGKVCGCGLHLSCHRAAIHGGQGPRAKSNVTLLESHPRVSQGKVFSVNG